ncbi:MAG TPA: DUF72 domain-containing protein [Solirubrobacteraceae bacterium]|nr:DUF72 domain-containing protein [Solirubrobacteraceae bacterium]
MRDVRLGLCGFTMGAPAYFREFAVVEVQQTFYDPPQDATLVRWRRRAPPRFEFTLKAWQLVTHEASSPTYRRLRRPLAAGERDQAGSFRDSAVVWSGWRRTLQCARLLRATAILLQCPRSFRPTDANVARLRAFCVTAERPEGVRLVWEPRGEWPAELVRSLCAELGLDHAVDPFTAPSQTPERPYFRLHGVSGPYHVHTDAELERLRGMLPSTANPAYVLFNNIPRVGDARRFRALLER